jgi:hypothetical protein
MNFSINDILGLSLEILSGRNCLQENQIILTLDLKLVHTYD